MTTSVKTPFDAIHEQVDRIGAAIGRGMVRRFPWGERLRDDALGDILDIMDAVEPSEGRELVWHLVLQGFDRRILASASRKGRRVYRQLTEQYADELRRPEDAPCYRFSMPWRVPSRIRAVERRDPIGPCLQRAYHQLGRHEDLDDGRGPRQVGGQDELIVGEDAGYAMAMDGQIWKVGWRDGSAAPIAEPPRMPAGAAVHPREPEKIYFCATRWSRRVPRTSSLGGIYTLEAGATPNVSPLVLRVPWRARERDLVPPRDPAAVGVYTDDEIDAGALRFDELTLGNSRPICYCNDLAVSSDGRLLYFTEPSPYTSMGLESKVEVVKLARNGFLWRVDLEDRTISLAAHSFSFVDGVLVLTDGRVLVTELARCRMLVLDFDSGTERVVQDALPGMPDGVARYDGKIWQALLHKRTWLITLLHRLPRLKQVAYPLLVRLVEPPKACGILVLDEATLEPIHWIMHDGSRLHHLATVAPSARGIFLPSFQEDTRGLHWVADFTR